MFQTKPPSSYHMSGGQNYLLLAMDMAKVGGPWWSTIRCEGFHTTLNIPSPLPTTLVSSYFRRLLISCVDIPFFFAPTATPK